MPRRADQPPHVDEQPGWPRLTLRRSDQAVAGVVAAGLLAALAGWWIGQEGASGGLVDIERAEPTAIEFKLDVNTADWPELALMPNIGEQLAKRIVEDRAVKGPFRELADLRRVRGIGPKTLEGMKPYLLPLRESIPSEEAPAAALPPSQ
jgi:competence protein ComEA